MDAAELARRVPLEALDAVAVEDVAVAALSFVA
jgi:hypothetical protein